MLQMRPNTLLENGVQLARSMSGVILLEKLEYLNTYIKQSPDKPQYTNL